MSTIGESSETFTSPSRLRKSVKERDVRRIIPLPPRQHPLISQYRRKRRSAPHETHRGQPPRRASTSRVTGRRADGSTSRVTRLRRDRGRRTKWREARAAATPPADLAAPQDRWLPRQKGSVPLAQVPPASCPLALDPRRWS